MRNLMKSAFGGKSKKAFTLIELLVVIAIIGILAAIVLVSLASARRKAQDAQVKSDITSMSQALEIVKVDRDLVSGGVYATVNDGATGNDRNIDRWREDGATAAPAKRLIVALPKHPISGQSYLILINANGYAILARLNPTNTYFCNIGGTTQQITDTLANAEAKCTP